MAERNVSNMKRQTILIVDDDRPLRILFEALLVRQGFVLDCVEDGTEALRRLSTASYDAILLDLMMPVTNGFDVLREFAAKRPALLRRTIIATGVNDRILDTIDRESVFAVLRKPFDIDQLVDTISRCASQPADHFDHWGGQRVPGDESGSPQTGPRA